MENLTIISLPEPMPRYDYNPVFDMTAYFNKKNATRLHEADRDFIDPDLMEDDGFVDCDSDYLVRP